MRTAVIWLGIIVLLLLLPIIGEQVIPQPEPGWFVFLGRFHILLIHLPIGVMVYVAVAEIYHLVRQRRMSLTTIWPLTFVAVVVPFVALLGYLLFRKIGPTPLLVRHMWTALAFSSLAILAYLAKRASLQPAAGRLSAGAYGLILTAAFVLMLISAHDGGSAVYGTTFLTRYAPEWLQKLTGTSPPPPAPILPTDQTLLFTAAVQPILTQHCTRCHGSDGPAGRLDLSSLDALLQGGINGNILAPGQPDQSLLIQRLMLPVHATGHMPPDRALPPDEIAVVRWWITSLLLPKPAPLSPRPAKINGFEVSGHTGTAQKPQ
jgi:hypothetical protein